MSGDTKQAARCEFAEELGPAPSIGPLRALGEIRQRGGKRVIAFCGEADFDTTSQVSNSFEIDWPYRTLPEVDRAAWFDLGTARSKILSAQTELLDRLEKGVP
jgi:predicted NUDIX family NTP pyrophosphohydrolase